MKPKTVYTVVFSPTGTSKKIAGAIARTASHDTEQPLANAVRKEIDLTYGAVTTTTLPRNALAIVAIPVYGGHPSPTALTRMKELHGEGTPAVVVAVYGNRDIDNAAAELASFLAARGFVPVAVAAFVGEHSYSTPIHPIAAGRPDDKDLDRAELFGIAIRQKLSEDRLAPIDATRLKAPRTSLLPKLRFVWFAVNYLRRHKHRPVPIPEGDAYRCTHCGRCAALCPTAAITRGNELYTDRTRCIRCLACVKSCPVHARSFRTPFGEALSRNFAARKEPVTLL